MPRELVRAPGHDRNRSLGWLAVAWIEHLTIHGPGDVQGDRVLLDDEFAGFVVDCYALDGTGRRLYDDAFISRAKGRAKSELGGLIGLFEAFGPCRFAGWARGGEQYRWRDFTYTYAPGEPMGQLVTYPFLRIMATEESQAGNVYDNIHFNLEHGPLGEGLPSDAVGLTRVFIPGGGEIVPSTASSASKDGGKETWVCFDEPHLYVKPEHRRMYATVQRNKAKRKAAQPWSLGASTMYQPGQDSVGERVHRRARAILAGKTRESRLLFDHVQAPDGVDLTDRAAIITALREVYGPFADVMDLDGIVEREFWNIERDVQDTRRYYFNMPAEPRDAWVTRAELAPNAGEYPPFAKGEAVALFFDGSKSDDSTVLTACRMSDGVTRVLRAWERPEDVKLGDWAVDKADVDLEVRRTHELFDVVAFFADVAEFESYIDTWAAELGRRYVVDATVGRKRHAVAWDMRGRTKDFTEAVERLLVDIRKGDAPYDEGDTVLVSHALHARRAPNKYGVSIQKAGRDHPDKIDAAVTWAGARMVRRLVLASPKWEKRRKRTGRVVGF